MKEKTKAKPTYIKSSDLLKRIEKLEAEVKKLKKVKPVVNNYISPRTNLQ